MNNTNFDIAGQVEVGHKGLSVAVTFGVLGAIPILRKHEYLAHFMHDKMS